MHHRKTSLLLIRSSKSENENGLWSLWFRIWPSGSHLACLMKRYATLSPLSSSPFNVLHGLYPLYQCMPPYSTSYFSWTTSHSHTSMGKMCHYLDWELNVELGTLKEFEDMIHKNFASPGPCPCITDNLETCCHGSQPISNCGFHQFISVHENHLHQKPCFLKLPTITSNPHIYHLHPYPIHPCWSDSKSSIFSVTTSAYKDDQSLVLSQFVNSKDHLASNGGGTDQSEDVHICIFLPLLLTLHSGAAFNCTPQYFGCFLNNILFTLKVMTAYYWRNFRMLLF